jgi:uncharacterized protein YbjT (DUF2867 family)
MAGMRALVTGATGFVGHRLAHALRADGAQVRCVVRDPERARDLEAIGCELCTGDMFDPGSLAGTGAGIDMAYYLVHSMGSGHGGADFAARDRAAAANFARAMRSDGAGRVAYLGGLGSEAASKHLRSRHETAGVLAQYGPPLTYFRAAMIVGAQSASYKILRALVARLPVMIAPSWLKTPTQPIGIDDVISYLRAAPAVEPAAGREVQIGGPDVLSYGEMLDVMADALEIRRRPRVPVPVLSPRLSSLWMGLVTPVDPGVAQPLVEGLTTETVVEDPAGAALFDVDPAPFSETLRRAVAEERELRSGSGSAR